MIGYVTGSKYIEVPADAMLIELRAIADAVRGRGGKAAEKVHQRELVFEVNPPNRLAFFRVYTSLAVGHDAVRGCGEDAVRIVLACEVPIGGLPRFKPLAKSRRIYRTAPKGPEPERVKAFLGRLKEALRESYQACLDIPTCTKCNAAPMAVRSTRDGSRSFLGCVRYPECDGTRPLPPKGNS